MGADRFNAARRQLGLKLVRRQAISAGHLGVAEAHLFDLIESARHVFAELIPKTVELKPDGAFEARTDTGRGRRGQRAAGAGEGETPDRAE